MISGSCDRFRSPQCTKAIRDQLMVVFEEDLGGMERFPRLIDEPGLRSLYSSVSILTEKTLTKSAFRKIGLEPS